MPAHHRKNRLSLKSKTSEPSPPLICPASACTTPERLDSPPDSSPVLSDSFVGGQLEALAESLWTSPVLEEAEKAPQPKTLNPRLSDEDFKLVRNLGFSIRKLTEARAHITKQLRSLTQATEKGNFPSFFRSSARPPHPHRGFQYRSSFLKSWEATNKKAARILLELTKEEYHHQAESIRRHIVRATESARTRIASHFLDPRQELTATTLFNSFSTARPRNRKRKRDE